MTRFGDHSTLFAEDMAIDRFLQNEVKGHLGVIRGQSVYTPYESWASGSFDQV